MDPVTIHFSNEQIIEALSLYLEKHQLTPKHGKYDVSVALMQGWRNPVEWSFTYTPAE